jgi:hypothetical protein
MNTLLSLLDFIVLVLLVIHVLRKVSAGLPTGPAAAILKICVALVVVFLATVSLTVYMGLVDEASSLMRVFLLAVVLAMAALVGMSWTSKPAA